MMLTTLLLVVWSIGIAASSHGVPVLHEDFSGKQNVRRDCVAVNCSCGTQPRICEVDGGYATCVPCPPGTFQPHGISSVHIENARLCEAHRECTSGSYFLTFDVLCCHLS